METVGDKYMCASGLPIKSTRHAHNIAQLALDMIDIINRTVIGGKQLTVSSSS